MPYAHSRGSHPQQTISVTVFIRFPTTERRLTWKTSESDYGAFGVNVRKRRLQLSSDCPSQHFLRWRTKTQFLEERFSRNWQSTIRYQSIISTNRARRKSKRATPPWLGFSSCPLLQRPKRATLH